MKLRGHIGRLVTANRFGGLARWALARPFGQKDGRRYAVIYEPSRISYSQIFPFVLHADAIERRHGVQLRFFSIDTAEQLDFAGIDRVILQAWFTRPSALIERVCQRAAAGGAQICAFLDSFAQNDVRLAPLVAGHAEHYLKKSLFRDRGAYLHPTRGHTNLTDYYNRLYGLDDEETHWQIPDGFVERLRLSAGFFTAPTLDRLFLDQDIETLLQGPRDIDVHARFTAHGSPWYAAMRAHAAEAIADLSGVSVTSEGIVSQRVFNRELARSKICFSPFGYGELCWRDVEAMAFGAVMLKPDMGHLETLPNIYEPFVTYVPVAWDFSDVPARVDWILEDEARAVAIARTAFTRIRDYLAADQVLDDMAFLFEA